MSGDLQFPQSGVLNKDGKLQREWLLYLQKTLQVNNQSIANGITGTAYTIQASDLSALVTFSNTLLVTVTLPNFPRGFYFWIANRGVGNVLVEPVNGLIDDASFLILTTGQGCLFGTDGQNFFTERGIGSGGAGMTNPMTTPADMIVGGVAGAPTRLAAGPDGTLLLMAGGVQIWSVDPAIEPAQHTLLGGI